MNYIVGSNQDKFFTEYYKQLEKAITDYPEEYAFPVSQLQTVFDKMRIAIEKGSANKDSRAIKATCKALGIKHTYKAMQEYLKAPTMFHAYIGELRGGKVKITTDRDCLSPELIRFDERVFATENDMLDCAISYRTRGYQVCIDTGTIFQDYR